MGEQSEISAPNQDRPQQLEELRFAKRQQWSVATLAITLLAAIFAIAHGTSLGDGEKLTATVVTIVIAACAAYFLIQLQGHLERTRTALNQNDKKAWSRGVDVLAVLMGTVFISGFVVIWFVWFHACATC